ncbi:MAG TPA: signal peptidase I [Ruminococcaceae bacterium]|nr:signal peptidase I [Oscillospiraceae bacterium]
MMSDNSKKKIFSVMKGKPFRIISNTVSTLVLIISIVLCAVVIISAKSGTGAPNFAGYSFLSVRSDSMEPSFYVGDLIIVRRYNASHTYKKGDVISFLAYDATGEMYINTHRIEEVVEGSSVSYVTKGDNAQKRDVKRVYPTKILGQYTGKRYAGLGKVFEFASTSKGVLLTVIIPAAIIVVWQLLNYFLSFSDKRIDEGVPQPAVAQQAPPQQYPPAAVDKDAVIREYIRKQQEEEFQRQKIIEEYLAKQKELEQAEKEKAEEAKIKAIISEFLAQQQALNQDSDTQDNNNQNS